MATGRRIGIDLGTTNSVVAVLDGPQPRVLESREGRPQVPSVVGLRRRKKGKKGGGGDGEVLVGSVAYDNWPMAPKDTIVSVKRLMARRVADPEVQKVRESYQYEVVEPSGGTKDSVVSCNAVLPAPELDRTRTASGASIFRETAAK